MSPGERAEVGEIRVGDETGKAKRRCSQPSSCWQQHQNSSWTYQ